MNLLTKSNSFKKPVLYRLNKNYIQFTKEGETLYESCNTYNHHPDLCRDFVPVGKNPGQYDGYADNAGVSRYRSRRAESSDFRIREHYDHHAYRRCHCRKCPV